MWMVIHKQSHKLSTEYINKFLLSLMRKRIGPFWFNCFLIFSRMEIAKIDENINFNSMLATPNERECQEYCHWGPIPTGI
jgi:hypothetical protein